MPLLDTVTLVEFFLSEVKVWSSRRLGLVAVPLLRILAGRKVGLWAAMLQDSPGLTVCPAAASREFHVCVCVCSRVCGYRSGVRADWTGAAMA